MNHRTRKIITEGQERAAAKSARILKEAQTPDAPSLDRAIRLMKLAHEARMSAAMRQDES